MHSRIAACLLALLPIAAFAQTPSDNRFTEEAAYTAQILSTEPLAIRYTLAGKGRFGTAELAEQLDGKSTLVYAYQGADVMIPSTGLVVDDESAYAFGYQNFVNPDPHHPVVSVTAYPDADQHALRYLRDITGRHQLNASFVVTFQPGVTYTPEAVHVQAVYFSRRPTAAPFIDVFHEADASRGAELSLAETASYSLFVNHHWSSSGWVRESNHSVSCPNAYAMMSRHHYGDENADTNYFCGTLAAWGSTGWLNVDLRNRRWSEWITESNGTWFACPYHRIMTGREHRGDENGSTRYECADIYVNGERHLLPSVDAWSGDMRESSHKYTCPDEITTPSTRYLSVMTGRHHRGDENGWTQYRCSKLQ